MTLTAVVRWWQRAVGLFFFHDFAVFVKSSTQMQTDIFFFVNCMYAFNITSGCVQITSFKLVKFWKWAYTNQKPYLLNLAYCPVKIILSGNSFESASFSNLSVEATLCFLFHCIRVMFLQYDFYFTEGEQKLQEAKSLKWPRSWGKTGLVWP